MKSEKKGKTLHWFTQESNGKINPILSGSFSSPHRMRMITMANGKDTHFLVNYWTRTSIDNPIMIFSFQFESEVAASEKESRRGRRYFLSDQAASSAIISQKRYNKIGARAKCTLAYYPYYQQPSFQRTQWKLHFSGNNIIRMMTIYIPVCSDNDYTGAPKQEKIVWMDDCQDQIYKL